MPVTYQDVCKAAEHLRKNNIRVSVRAVTSITKGSHSHVGPLVEQWKRDNPQGQPSLPEKILKPLIDHLMDMQANHEQDLQEEVENSQSLQEEIEGVRSKLVVANNMKVEAELLHKSEKHRADSLESRCIDLESKLRQVENELISQRAINQGLDQVIATLRESNDTFNKLASQKA